MISRIKNADKDDNNHLALKCTYSQALGFPQQVLELSWEAFEGKKKIWLPSQPVGLLDDEIMWCNLKFSLTVN